MNNTRKRVSFGSHGSMVETLIIDEMPVSKEERNFYNQNILQMERNNKTYNLTTTKNKRPEFQVSITEVKSTKKEGRWPPSPTSITPTAPPPPIVITPIRRTHSMESQDNPFQPDGDLSKEVEMMLKRSTISRTQVLIGDKDNPQPTNGEPEPVSEPAVQATPAITVSAEKPQTEPNDVSKPNESSNEIKPKENGKVDETTSPQQVDVKVTAPEDSNKDSAPENKADSPSESEKPKKVRGKCCSIM